MQRNAPDEEAPGGDKEPGLAGILAKIRDVEGEDPLLTAFVDRYGFSREEAILWTRHLGLLWNELEADYLDGQPEDAVSTRSPRRPSGS